MNKDSWEILKLVDICLFFNDGNWIESKDQSESGIRLIQTGNIGNGYYINKEARAKFISEDTFKNLKCTEVFEGDCLVSRLPDPIGRACIVPLIKGRAITSVDCSILRFKPNILASYFVYFSQCKKYTLNIKKSSTGSTRKRISRSNLGNILVPIPPLPIQAKIVKELDTLSDIITKKKEQLAELDKLAQATFYDMFGDPVENEKEWNNKLWSEVLTIYNGKNQKKVENKNGEYPICGSGGIMGYADAYICPENTVIIGRKGNINKPIFMRKKFWNVDTAFGLVANNNELNPNFLFYFCLNYNFEKHNKAVTIPSLTKTDLLKIAMPCPPLSLQNQFAEKIEAIEKQKALINQSITDTQLLFDYTMDKYFN